MINLLPFSEREILHAQLLKRQIRSFGLIISAILLGCAVFTLNTFAFLKIQTSELKQSLNVEAINSETKEAQIFEGEIKGLNSNLTRYQNFRSEPFSVLNVFLKIKEIAPAGANLNSLLYDAASKKIIVSGVAQSRNDVVAMESRLKKSDFFERVESPLNNFLDSANARFNFTFYVKQ
ncbi:MAG: PilN domain-containing protein [Patescibacteria group bacterium]